MANDWTLGSYHCEIFLRYIVTKLHCAHFNLVFQASSGPEPYLLKWIVSTIYLNLLCVPWRKIHLTIPLLNDQTPQTHGQTILSRLPLQIPMMLMIQTMDKAEVPRQDHSSPQIRTNV